MIVAIYDSLDLADQAVSNLIEHGFSIEDISLISGGSMAKSSPDELRFETSDASSSGEVHAAGAGAVLGGLSGLLVGLGVIFIPGIGPVLAGGPLPVALTTLAGAAAGGIIGALVESGVPEAEAHDFVESMRRGGVLVTVRAEDIRAAEARQILDNQYPTEVEKAPKLWPERDWGSFDPTGEPGETEDIGRARNRSELEALQRKQMN
jgi:hypothetical protein